MSTTAELLQAQKRKAQKALDNKANIKQSLSNKRGKDVGDNQSTWASEIDAIEPLLDTLDIKKNGLYDAKDYKNVNVFIESEDFDTFKKLIERTGGNSITIPYGVTKIGYNALWTEDSTYNKYVLYNHYYLPSTITSIAAHSMSFYYDNEKSRIYFGGTLEQWASIPKGQYDNSTYNSTFANSTYTYYLYLNEQLVNEITLSNQTLSMYSFSHIKLNKVHITKEVKQIGIGLFKNSDIQEITFDNECEFETIPFHAFSSIKNLKTLSLPKFKTMGEAAFISCSALEEVNLKEGVTNISQNGFLGCSKLKKIILPQSITHIYSQAFNGCSVLNEIVIPKNIVQIYPNAFSFYMKTITIENPVPCTISTSSFSTPNGFKIYVPRGTSETYKSATNWSKYASYIYEKYNVVTNIPTALVNNETITYSIDGGKTYQMFTNGVLTTTDVSTIKIKSTDSTQTILIGTTQGGNDVGTIANSELTFSFSGDTTIYLTIQ